MQYRFVLPLSYTARSVLNKTIVVDYSWKKKEKTPKTCSGKLSHFDVDLIRVLLFKGVSQKTIAKIFAVTNPNINSIKMLNLHSKYISVFQNNNYNPLDFDGHKVNTWIDQNKERIICVIKQSDAELVRKIEALYALNFKTI